MIKLKHNKRANESSRKFNSNSSFTDETGYYDDAANRKWYEHFAEDPEECSELPDTEVSSLKEEAKKCLENDTLIYNNKTERSSAKSDYRWLKTMMAKGTVSDKIAAFTVVIQNSPVHTLSTLRNLVNMVKVGKKKECVLVIETLAELFLSDLLPPDRKLLPFECRPLSHLDQLSSGNKTSRNGHLVHWYFEDELKQLYRAFIQALQVVAHDTVDSNKEKAVAAIYKLLAGNPEQESVLLSNLVNKLGDPSQKVGSKAIYCLGQLLQEHPNMKTVVMVEIEKLLFRSNVSPRAQYYGICFLTQFLLSHEDATLAVNLIKLYFAFFKGCLKKGDVDTRMMSALLTGVNRAYPFTEGDMTQISEHIQTMYKVVHIASFNISLHALCLLYQVANHNNAVSDRFFSALYKKLLDPQFGLSSQQATLINLTFRALKRDVSDNRVQAFIKRLLQVCLYLPVPLVCGILYMVSQLLHKNRALLTVQMKATLFSTEDDGDRDEHYEDVKIEEESKPEVTPLDEDLKDVNDAKDPAEDVKPPATWFHTQNLQDKTNQSQYKPLQRNPLFAGGEFCVHTELLQLRDHYHPSVTLFANKILQGETIIYSGDPLQDFTLARFLERFVFKNPKKNVANKLEQSLKFSRKSGYMPQGVKTMAVNSIGYLNTDESSIPVDELFMFRYLMKKKETVAKKEDAGSDADSVASEEFEEMLDNLMGGKKEMNFADDVGSKLPTRKRKGPASDEEDDDLEEDDDIKGEDDDNEEDDSDPYEELNEFDDVEDMVFDDDDDDDNFAFDMDDLSDEDSKVKSKSKHKVNGKQQKKALKKGGIDQSIFASADEFAEMLQDTGASEFKLGGSTSLSDKDKASTKQLKWEVARDHWVSKGAPRGKRKGGNKPHNRPAKRFKK